MLLLLDVIIMHRVTFKPDYKFVISMQYLFGITLKQLPLVRCFSKFCARFNEHVQFTRLLLARQNRLKIVYLQLFQLQGHDNGDNINSILI